jgi:hypothetical protein
MRQAGFTLLAISALLVASPPARANAPLLQACVNKGNGMMRFVNAATDCHANETFIQWNQTGPQGPQGPQGVAGTSAGGPPYVLVCTALNYHNAGTTRAHLFLFNGSSSTANVAVNPLSKNGTNLAGATVAVSPGTLNPGDPTPVYPGQTGTSTVTLAAANTMILNWYTADGNIDTDNTIAVTMRITSDQPIIAATEIAFNGFNVVPCVALPH